MLAQSAENAGSGRLGDGRRHAAQDAYRLLVASDLRDLRRGIKQRRSDYSCEVFRHRVGLIGERMDFRSVDFAYYGDLAGRASTDPKQVCELEQFGIAIHGCASPMTDIRGSVSSEAWASAPQARIDAQTPIVAGLTPGSVNHRVSTSVLLMLQDSLFVLSQTKKMVEAAREQALGGRA